MKDKDRDKERDRDRSRKDRDGHRRDKDRSRRSRFVDAEHRELLRYEGITRNNFIKTNKCNFALCHNI